MPLGDANGLGRSQRDLVNSAEKPEKKLAGSLGFQSDQARIQDLLRLFTSAPRPTMAGPMVLDANVVAPPGEAPFMKKVRLHGSFAIGQARFTARGTQNKIDEFSTRSRGGGIDQENGTDLEHAVSELKGNAILLDGEANLADLIFRIPGATATGRGTYNVITKRVNIKGVVSMDVTLSRATSGLKSLLLKPIQLFLRKNGKGGSVVPVSLTGTSSEPRFRLHLRRNP